MLRVYANTAFPRQWSGRGGEKRGGGGGGRNQDRVSGPFFEEALRARAPPSSLIYKIHLHVVKHSCRSAVDTINRFVLSGKKREKKIEKKGKSKQINAQRARENGFARGASLPVSPSARPRRRSPSLRFRFSGKSGPLHARTANKQTRRPGARDPRHNEP